MFLINDGLTVSMKVPYTFLLMLVFFFFVFFVYVFLFLILPFLFLSQDSKSPVKEKNRRMLYSTRARNHSFLQGEYIRKRQQYARPPSN
ncbi:hypothetical protein CROQUDRAFT_560630 [Cronartium quercuum f. sp. fusiforme G11]|uniref:Uncharacterized protein n=1 Tax=Cronartium quercuum f. sp. fusiforme G11 TaxID=708437 RepID=A0A9P6T653_9BASI|nr:hypothetical protein CROQUDRAFT_560630 [Cronartium quercuum f. sp. fusiforme G11]